MLHALELRLDVLLGDLQEPEDAVVSLLRDHVKDVSEALRAPLPPGLVHAERHILSALLPAEELNVCLALIQALRIVESRAWEDTHDLRELDNTLGQGRRAMLQVLEGLLVDLGVEHVVDGVHLSLPVLFVHVALLLHLAHRVAVLLDVHLVGSALHRQTVHLLSELQDIPLVLAEPALHATHAEVQRAKPAGGLSAAELCLLLHGANLLEGLLLLLPDIVLQARLRVRNVALEVAPYHCYLVKAIAEGVLRSVEALLRGR